MRYKYTLLFSYLTLATLLLLPYITWSQNLAIDGRFIEAETKVGDTIHYVLKLRHHPSLEVVFPDSTYDFAPFELVHQRAFPTRTDSISSLDSVVYTIATYELDARQGLKLPIFIADPTAMDGHRKLFPQADSIDLQPLITEMPDSVVTFENTQLAYVAEEFNYPYLLIGIGSSLMTVGLIYILFGSSIKKAILLKRLKRDHEQFINKFQHYSEGSQVNVEKAVGHWKRHIGLLLDLPISSYTTKEISRKVTDVPEKVLSSLRQTDQAIYAGLQKDDLLDSFRELRTFAEITYNKRVEEIKKDK